MGNNVSFEAKKNEENVQYYSNTQSKNSLICRPKNIKNINFTNSPNFSINSSNLSYITNDSSRKSNHVIKKSTKHDAIKKSLSLFKKRKNLLYKCDLQSVKSIDSIEDKLIQQKLNKHIQAGNGLIRLQNLNDYLHSNDKYELVNQMIKSVGLFNQWTQTNFDKLDEKCLMLIEVSQNLVEQLTSLNTDYFIADETQDESNDNFDIIYWGKNNKQNKRNVCIQKCIRKSTVGTQTIESSAHLIIIQILKKLSLIDEQVYSIHEVRCFDKSEKKIIEKYDLHFYTEHKKLNQEISHKLNNNNKILFKKSNFKNLNKHKSKTYDSNLLNICKTIYKKKFHSQPILSEKNNIDRDKTNQKSFKMNEVNPFYVSYDQLNSMNKTKLEEYLKNLLLQIQLSQEHQKKVKSRNACVQTMNDIISDELPEYAARCPSLRKKELIYSPNLFDSTDKRALEAPEFSDLKSLVAYLTEDCENDIFKVRILFKWITNNMNFDWNYLKKQQNRMKDTINRSNTNIDTIKSKNNNNIIEEENEKEYLENDSICFQNECHNSENKIETIYQTKSGSSKEFVEIFMEMCKQCEIRCKMIQGFAKNYDYRPDHKFLEEDISSQINVHYWVAVFVITNWHLIDLTWGTGYTDPIGKFQRKFNEFFFFTDPEHLVYTHFPFNPLEREYERWQLLDKPISLNDFNALPKITANFFALNLKIRSKIGNPISFKIQTEIKISSHEPIRYKYKLFHVDELENCVLNNFVFCQLKNERLVASFVVCPPVPGLYYFKVYARAEKEISQNQNQANSSLFYILTMLLDCTKARKYQNPYPLNELPYGPVQSFYNFKMQLVNQNSAIISSFGGKRKLILQCHEPMLITYQIVDADGQEQDIRSIISRDDENSTNLITLVILPPRVGLFKLSIFGAPRSKPSQPRKTRLPLLATFLIDCRLAKIVSKNVDPEPLPADLIDNFGKK